MKEHRIIWIIAIAATLLLAGVSCTTPPADNASDNPDDRQDSTGAVVQDEGAVEEETAGSDEAPVETPEDGMWSGELLTSDSELPEDDFERAEYLAFEMLEKLDYDRDLLRVEFSENQYDIFGEGSKYHVMIADSVGDFAHIVLDEYATRIEKLIFKAPIRDDRPSLLAPGPDLPETVARRLGFLDEGYEHPSWMLPSIITHYRKYSMIGDWRVCTSMVYITVDDETGELESVEIHEQIPFPEISIDVSEDEAIVTAVEALYEFDITPIHAELIQVPPGYHGNPWEAVLWEVYFDNGAWCLVMIDGSGWLSSNVPNPPEEE